MPNKYHLSLTLFCGANHHHSSIVFITTFISKENIRASVWSLPNVSRLHGHITNNMEDKIGNMYHNNKAMRNFYNLLNDLTMSIECESRWGTWIEENRLRGNVLLKDIYDL